MYCDFSLEGKTAVVTGGGRGIGRSIALGLARAGANVVPVSRSQDDIFRVVKEIEQEGRRSKMITADVTDPGQVKKLFKSASSEFGNVEILVNCAGIHVKKPFLEITDEEWDMVLNTNLRAVVHTCRIFGEQMCRQGYGKIINISSVGGIAGIINASAYCASKAGVILLTKVLALEWAEKNVCVNAIVPGFIDTEMTRPIFASGDVLKRVLDNVPMKRLGEPEDVVGAAIFLASDASRFVTGTVLTVDGGVTSKVS